MAASARSFTNLSSNEFGGYDFDFKDKLPDECPCLVCTLVQRNPHQVTCCGKIYCKTCLDKLMKDKHYCPNCRANLLKDKKYFPDINTERKINHLRIYCMNKREGCRWIGFLKDFQKTHVSKCRIQRSICPNVRSREESLVMAGRFETVKCGKLIRRSELNKHVSEECEFREATCCHCKMKGTHQFITGDHVQKRCPEVFVSCENNECEQSVRRKHLLEHKSSCPKEMLDCPFSFVGCLTKLKRESMAEHDQENMKEHLAKTVVKMKNMAHQLECMSHAIDEMRYGGSYDHFSFTSSEDY